ncbi:hypothetical protein FDECE_12845 [Fusarium decemcellulare]|nr:hypothetical protein FDECE_12845 [Fusarium decemcellulare]
MPRKLTRHFRLGRRPSSHAKAETQRVIAHNQHETLHAPAKEIEINARSPVPLDSTKPSVAQLPDDVVHTILGLLQRVRPEALQAVALVSSSLYCQARYVQSQHVHIDLDRPNNALDRLSLISRLRHAAAVRAVRVVGFRTSNQDAQDRNQVLVHLVNMMPSMTGLSRFDWHVRQFSLGSSLDDEGWTSLPIPSGILTALPRLGPHLVRLHTSVWCCALESSHDETRTFLHSLEGNQNLSTLSVEVVYMSDEMCRDTMRALKRVLLSCPNLTKLPQIDVHFPRGTCFGGGPEGPYCGFGFSGDEKPPPLQELGLHEYPWGRTNWTGYPNQTGEAVHWARAFDWSQLTRLNLIPDFLLETIAPSLTGVRDLALDQPSPMGIEPLDDITSPLEMLSLSTWKRVGKEPRRIIKFASTLRRLRIHDDESGWKYDSHSFITAPDLIHLSTSLPNLQHLALDMERDKETQQWPYEMLDAIAAFPALRTVELWFAVGHGPPAPQPLLTVSSARHLGDYLRARNDKIQRLTFHSGALDPGSGPRLRCPLGDDFYVPGPSWAKQNSVTFEYEMIYDSEVPNHQRVNVICLDLSSAMNARLCQLAQGATRPQTDPGELGADEIRLIAALDGPLDKVKWNAWLNKQPEVIAYNADTQRIHDEIEAIINRSSLRRRLAALVRR